MSSNSRSGSGSHGHSGCRKSDLQGCRVLKISQSANMPISKNVATQFHCPCLSKEAFP